MTYGQALDVLQWLTAPVMFAAALVCGLAWLVVARSYAVGTVITRYEAALIALAMFAQAGYFWQFLLLGGAERSPEMLLIGRASIRIITMWLYLANVTVCIFALLRNRGR